MNKTPLRAASFIALLLSAGALLLSPAEAQASPGEAQVWGGAAITNANKVGTGGQWGLGLQLGALADITDFWSIFGGVDTGHHFATSLDSDTELPAAQILGVFAGFRYNLDLFKYVPYVALSIENYIATPPIDPGESVPNVGAKLSVGMDWRFDRHYSLGALIELHTTIEDIADLPIYSTLGANFTYHFRL